MLKNLLQIHLKLLQKTGDATSDLIGINITDAVAKSYNGKITKVLQTSQKNNSETVIYENDEEIPKERHKFLE